MELKVWCEGIQRVICGVTEGTTCHNLVVALAQAMGKTGRYTLVEKWRESERLVSPEEYPLVILHQWGEYANDVQFILRHSGSRDRKGSAGNQGDKSDSESGRTSKLSYHNFSPHLSESRSSSMSSLKKSLTFSGAHSHSTLVPKTDSRARHKDQGSLQENSSLESLTEQSSQSSSSNFANSSAHSSWEQRRRTRLQDSLSSQSSASSLDPRNRSSVFPNTKGPPSHGNVPYSYTGGSLDRTRKRNRDQNKLQNTSSSSQHLSNSHPHPNGHIQPPRNRPSPPSSRLPKESNNNIDYKPNANLKYQISEQGEKSAEESSTKTSERSRDEEEEREEDKKKMDLIKVVNLQMEKMQRQQEDMTQMDKEILSREETEKKHKEDESRILEEIAFLEKQEVDMDSDLQDLELVSWVDKLDMEQEKERRIRLEIQNMNGKIQDCQKAIAKHEGIVKTISADLSREKDARSKEEKQQKEEELKTLQEISDLQKQINTHLKKHEEQNASIEELQTEVKGLESKILERKTQIGDLERDLKDSNMDRFSRAPADWIRGSHEERSPFNRSSSTSRPSSARRLESPQRLKETVATPKNPHGLWV